jgi:hypothetical protein
METHQNIKKKTGLEKDNVVLSDTATLPELLKQFITIQSNIAGLKGQLKNLNTTSKLIESKILLIMNDKNLQNIDTQSTTIQVKTTTVRKQINQTLLTNFFGTKLNIPQTAIQQFVEQLPSKTTQTLVLKTK